MSIVCFGSDNGRVRIAVCQIICSVRSFCSAGYSAIALCVSKCVNRNIYISFNLSARIGRQNCIVTLQICHARDIAVLSGTISYVCVRVAFVDKARVHQADNSAETKLRCSADRNSAFHAGRIDKRIAACFSGNSTVSVNSVVVVDVSNNVQICHKAGNHAEISTHFVDDAAASINTAIIFWFFIALAAELVVLSCQSVAISDKGDVLQTFRNHVVNRLVCAEHNPADRI